MADDPFDLFKRWFAEACASEPNDPEAVALATADAAGQPSLRMVLVKDHGPAGFTFYTNSGSQKGRELALNPFAGMLFHWKSLRRQVRVEGPVEPLSEAEADSYFATRGRDSQLGAWASDQSRALDSRATIATRLEEATARFAGGDVPRPSYWRGYRLVPRRIEFWTDRPHRLHERRLFTRAPGSESGAGPDGWDEGLLYP